ncbi:MAG: ATP phosphoribosyltransferase [Chloroflexota bacterium]
MTREGNLRLALANNSDLHDPTMRFLEACGLSVERSSARRYTATIPSLAGVTVLFQRSADIPAKVEEGSADLGIAGLDRFLEVREEDGDTALLIDRLGYSHCELVIGVPDAWIDVSSVVDLADVSLALREKGRQLRVVTKYPRLTQQFFLGRGVNYFTCVDASGAMEAAPFMGYADIIVDITSSGVTLRENRLKTIAEGTILRSQACFIGNLRLLREDPMKLEITKGMLELIEARLRSLGYYSITANIRGDSAEAVAQHVISCQDVAGIQGPTVSKVYSRLTEEQDWFAVTVVVARNRLLRSVEHLREIGGSGITVLPASYVFEKESTAYSRLLGELRSFGKKTSRRSVV